MALRQRYLFVCVNRRAEDDPKGCCSARGSAEIRAALKERATLGEVCGVMRDEFGEYSEA